MHITQIALKSWFVKKLLCLSTLFSNVSFLITLIVQFSLLIVIHSLHSVMSAFLPVIWVLNSLGKLGKLIFARPGTTLSSVLDKIVDTLYPLPPIQCWSKTVFSETRSLSAWSFCQWNLKHVSTHFVQDCYSLIVCSPNFPSTSITQAMHSLWNAKCML